jgi:hypothetical protein
MYKKTYSKFSLPQASLNYFRCADSQIMWACHHGAIESAENSVGVRKYRKSQNALRLREAANVA